MAAYHDPYDSRPGSSGSRRRGDGVQFPAGHAGASSNNRDSGEVPTVPRPNYYSSRAQRYSYDARDARYQYPPPPPPDVGRPGPPRRRRASWPPPATCEDEVVALAREAGTSAVLKVLKEVRKDEARSRGVIDQEPLIEDVPEYMNQDDRRPVLTSDSEKEGRDTGIPTPPTSEDEQTRRLRRRPSRLTTQFDDAVPEVTRRTASPYAYTKPTKLPKDLSSNDRFLSPTTLTPPPTDSGRRRRERLSTTSKVSSPRRDSQRVSPSARKGNDYFSSNYSSSENAIVDDDWDTSDSASHNRRRRPTATRTYPPPKTSRQTDVKDFAPNAPSIRRLNLDARRNTDTAGTLPTLPSLRVDKPRRPAPYMAAGALGALGALSDLGSSASQSAPGTPAGTDLPLPRSRESSYMSSRGLSPTPSHAEPSPPPSARHSRDMSFAKAQSSSPHSGSGSAAASRPQSPSPRTPADTARLPKTDLDWSTLLAANAARKSKPPSRLAASMRQDSVPDVYSNAPHSAGHAPRHTNSLPYPQDFGPGTPTMYMPSEQQYFTPPRPKLDVPMESKTQSRAASPAASNTSRTSTGSRDSRPGLPIRAMSTANIAPLDERPRTASRRHDSFSTSSQTKKELSALMKKGLPECPRAEARAGHDDWYTVIGAPGLAFCPDCVDRVFERTIFRPSIRRLPQLNLNTKIGCAFGSSPWLRLAWLLTLQQHRTDLTLLKDMAEIDETSESCPGATSAPRSWYSVRDNTGLFVRDFNICYADVRRIERLLPTLSGFFVRLPQRAAYEKHTCAIRADGNRFSAYLDGLITTHERALTSRKGADPMPFVDLVERKTRLQECMKDTLLDKQFWHFIPSVPTLTVCEDCYEAVVEPEVRKNNDVAMRFNRTVQPIREEGMGSSCQLYSRRMRAIFKRALEDSDIKYLARKSEERREAELRLQGRYREVVRRHKRASREGALDPDEERRLSREVDRITEEWKERWE